MSISSNYLIFGMAAGLAYLGIVTALTIDNQLTVIKNDCYERMAIGQRLNPKNVLKSFEYNTLSECQAACTKQEIGCKAFSFGIGTKGNGTCELSFDSIKETADLKPIGTVAATDYDLYIKKIGCSLVVDKTPHDKPPPEYSDTSLKPTDAVSRPTSDSKPVYENPQPDDKYHHMENEYPKPPYSSNYNNQQYLPPNSDEIHHVQSLVSVASGPNSILHPIHDILVGEGPYNYGRPHKPRPTGCCDKNRDCCAPSDLPPFRPAILNHPYDDMKPLYRPRPDDFDEPLHDRPDRHHGRPGHSYDGPNSHDRPEHFYDRPPSGRPGPGYDRPDLPYDKPSSSYDRPNSFYDRPKPPYGRPGSDGYDRPEQSFDTRRWDNQHGYDYDRPEKRPARPQNEDYDRPHRPERPHNNGYDMPPRKPYGPDEHSYDPVSNSIEYDRPLPPKYGSVIPHPDYYNKRPGSNDYPGNDIYDRPPKRPYYDRPADQDFQGYHYDKPSKPQQIYGNSKPEEPYPEFNYDRPYGPKPPSRPQIYDDGKPLGDGSYPDDRPYRPKPPSRPQTYDEGKPLGDGSYPDDRPYRPKPPSRPYPDVSYDKPMRPPTYDTNKPNDGGPYIDYYDRPSKPPSGLNIYDKPPKPNGDSQPGYYYDKPSKPLPDSGNKGGKPYPDSPGSSGGGYGPGNDKPNGPSDPNNPTGGNKPLGQKVTYENGSIVSTSIGPHGEQITSIITELKETCFRRVLAGKRAARRCVKRSLTCETVEECQQECAEERYFICEGFNYRLDPTGRGKGDCELLDLPLSQLDIGRDLYPDPDYDYYERDRNAASANCKQWPNRGGGYYPPYRGGGGGGYGDRDGYGGGGGYRGGGSYGGGKYGPGGGYGDGGNRDGFIDRVFDDRGRPSSKGDRIPSRYGSGLRRPGDRWTEDDDYNYRPLGPSKPGYGYDSRPDGNRRGDFSYHHSPPQDYQNSRRYYHDRDRYDYQGNRGIHYLPAHYYKPVYESDRYKPYEPYLPPNRFFDRPRDRYDQKYSNNRNRDRNWGLDRYGWGSYGNFGHPDSYYGYKYQYNNRNRFDIDRRHYYLPPRNDIPKDWGLYGGTYGNGGDYYHHDTFGNKDSYEYWGFYKYDDQKPFYHEFPPSGGSSYLPLPVIKPPSVSYLPKPPVRGFTPKPLGGYYLPLPERPSSHFGYGSGVIPPNNLDNSLLPAEPRRPPKYDFIKDECSLRSAAGFRLHKGIVKKFFAVPNIYECEMLCFREKEFPCASYAYRYTISSATPTDNCYLSNRNYKELDYYTDLEPDRDFDIYTMNNKGKCEAPIVHGKDKSECFWRVRSGQRLAHKVVRDSLTAKSIVECQVECLKSTRFTCRAFSFRYGSPIIGGVIDNCQLTDWPYFELDPRSHFVPEPGFEVYERGSFGHGCEPDHFGIRNNNRKDEGTEVDQLCYIGFGSPARLLPQAAKKTVYVPTELECKAECSKTREKTLFQCMSFSYRAKGPQGVPNCQFSDILQRDLLPNVDYVYDPDYLLFAWDNYSPECIRLANEPVHGNTVDTQSGIDSRYGWDVFHALDTWRVYSVSGWPCKRGSLCQENRQAGFWYCELEGGGKDSWDYCCRPSHRCGASKGYPYQWCYVGPEKTQWRKCSDRYYPYIHNDVGKVDISKLYLPVPPPHQKPSWRPPSYRPGGRPDRPPPIALDSPPTPSLDEYEKLFENEFLDPPKPGGLIQARHWPVSYLHKEMPPNSTDSEPRLMRMEKEVNPKYEAIKNLINVIKNNDLKNVQYHISNESNNAKDILFVKIPLPTNFTKEGKGEKRNSVQSNTSVNLQPVDLDDEDINIQTKRSHKALSPVSEERKEASYRFESNTYRSSPVYRRGFVTRTNLTEGRLSF